MTDPKAGPPRRLRLSEWPCEDRNMWITAQQPGDPLDSSIGFATRWKPSTCRLNETGYGYWLGHLHETGQLDPEVPPGERATLPSISAYLTMMRETQLAAYTVAGRMQQLGNTCARSPPVRTGQGSCARPPACTQKRHQCATSGQTCSHQKIFCCSPMT